MDSANKPVDVVAARRTALGMGGLALLLWLVMGPDNPIVALLVTFTTANLGLAVIPIARRIPARCYHVPSAERLLHVVLGVPVFGWLLDKTGWNRVVALPLRQQKVSKAGLQRLVEHIHATEGAHAIAFIPHAVLTAVLLATGHQSGALWILVPGVILHLYPVLLQRWMTLRVEPLLRRSRRGLGAD